jgi:hypothetical protein
MSSTTVRCPACNRPLSPPVPIICPGCGSDTDRPPMVAPPEAGAVALIQGTTADDGNPYTVMGGKPVPRCPECDARLSADDAPACDRCGWDRAARRKVPKTFVPIHRTWEAGWPLRTRVIAFVVCQGLNVGTVVLAIAVESRALTTVGGFMVAVICQALLLGTFDRLDLTRTAKGKVTLTQQWRVAFSPLPPKTLRWREHEEIRVLHAEPGALEWVMFLGLLCTTLIGGLVWYWYVIRPGHVKAALCKSLGDPVTPLYLGTSMERAEELAREVAEVTGLSWRPHGG